VRFRSSPNARAAAAAFALAWVAGPPLTAQLSHAALRFHGTGVGPPGQQDRALFAVDDNAPGDASTPLDVGAGNFTLELWVRGLLADNGTANAGGDIDLYDFSWIDGNIVLDRDIWCGAGSERKYGVSFAGGFVRFGTATGAPAVDPSHTLEGSTNVLDGVWHHVAVVRDATSGRKRIYVDAALDFESDDEVSFADHSYPDAGIPVTGNCGTGQLTPYGWYLVLGAEKHDAGPAYPSFAGYVDELRVWTTARNAAEIGATWRRVVHPAAPGLVAAYRFEEGTGTALASSSAAPAPTGSLVAGVTGNGEWVTRAANSANTAPLVDLPFADAFELGNLSLWSSSTP
jgi:hypothetical protein